MILACRVSLRSRVALLCRPARRLAFGALGALLAALLIIPPAMAGGSKHKAYAGVGSCQGRWPCDLGGAFILTDYLRQRHGGGVIAGICYSRCTMALISGACVTPGAVLGFHAVTNAFGFIDRIASETVESLYPLGIRHWLRQTGAMNSLQIRTMTGLQAIRLGVPACARELRATRLR